jgi:hypothetical protein
MKGCVVGFHGYGLKGDACGLKGDAYGLKGDAYGLKGCFFCVPCSTVLNMITMFLTSVPICDRFFFFLYY